jgi:hypothetical protein
MPDEKQSEGAPGEPGGIFGKLPSARPGVRSPRRAPARRAQETKGATEPASAGTAGGAASRASPPPPPPSSRRASSPPSGRPSPPPPSRDDAPEAPGGRGGGVEDVAWAGITVAAEAATLGVRLLSRAVEAVRKPTERR